MINRPMDAEQDLKSSNPNQYSLKAYGIGKW